MKKTALLFLLILLPLTSQASYTVTLYYFDNTSQTRTVCILKFITAGGATNTPGHFEIVFTSTDVISQSTTPPTSATTSNPFAALFATPTQLQNPPTDAPLNWDDILLIAHNTAHGTTPPTFRIKPGTQLFGHLNGIFLLSPSPASQSESKTAYDSDKYKKVTFTSQTGYTIAFYFELNTQIKWQIAAIYIFHKEKTTSSVSKQGKYVTTEFQNHLSDRKKKKRREDDDEDSSGSPPSLQTISTNHLICQCSINPYDCLNSITGKSSLLPDSYKEPVFFLILLAFIAKQSFGSFYLY